MQPYQTRVTSTALLISVLWYQALQGHRRRPPVADYLSPEAEQGDRGESFAALGILVVVTERPRRILDTNSQGLWSLLNVLNSALPRRFTGL